MCDWRGGRPVYCSRRTASIVHLRIGRRVFPATNTQGSVHPLDPRNHYRG